MHRLHHAYADTEKDPHSPKYSKNILDMMWKTKKIYQSILHDKIIIDESFKKNIPDWKWMEKVGDSWYSRICWGAAYTLFYMEFAGSRWIFLLLPIHYLMGPVHGAIINWFAHKYGYINFKVKDTARNLLFFDFLMMGESYHNNHHKFGGRANFGKKWFEIDPTYPVILLLNGLKIIKLKKNNDLSYM